MPYLLNFKNGIVCNFQSFCSHLEIVMVLCTAMDETPPDTQTTIANIRLVNEFTSLAVDPVNNHLKQ